MLLSWPVLIIITYLLVNWALKIAEKKFAEQESIPVESKE